MSFLWIISCMDFQKSTFRKFNIFSRLNGKFQRTENIWKFMSYPPQKKQWLNKENNYVKDLHGDIENLNDKLYKEKLYWRVCKFQVNKN